MEAILESFGWVHFWVIVGVILAIIEILTVSFFALPFAIGALFTAIFAYLNVPLPGQIGIFAVSSFAMLFTIQKGVKKYLTSEESRQVKTGIAALIGKNAIVLERIEGRMQRGQIKVGGERWSAVAEGEETFEVEEKVRVVSSDGAKLVVSRLDEQD